MPDEPGQETLHGIQQELKDLYDGYPADAPDEERAAYFAAAIRRGLEAHRLSGQSEEEILEKVGLSVGVSSSTLRAWMEKRPKVHPQFHQGALLAQASLMTDHIKACRLVLEKIRSHLDAGDRHGGLGAYQHLKEIGLKALATRGGRLGQETVGHLDMTEDVDSATSGHDMRRLALTAIAQALREFIGEPPDTEAEGNTTARGAAPRSARLN